MLVCAIDVIIKTFLLQFDQNGQTKTKGYLTTAEGADETINGKTTGFRAATTSVQDDGKVSIFSVHSK